MVLSKLKNKLSKSREKLSYKLSSTLKLHPILDEALWEEITEILISADVGVDPSLSIVDEVKKRAITQKARAGQVREVLKTVLVENLRDEKPKMFSTDKQIILVIGVNGTGKTTTIAKLANLAVKQDKSVILAAGDTFRAAAIEQLSLWGGRLNLPVVSHQRGSDSGAVVFDAINAAKARNINYVIADTAGRLHTQTNLMEELKKIHHISQRESDSYGVVVILVLDANIGQNALAQTKTFNDNIGVDELFLAKLDSTAKGGIVIAVTKQTGLPIGFIGIGEGLDDISSFDAQEFVKALIG